MTLSTLLALLFFSCACYAQTGEDAMLEQARHHFNSGNYYFATTWLGRFLNTYPASLQRKDVLLLISKAYALSGREERAVPYLRDLLKEFPETATNLDPQLLKLAQSGEPTRPATIVTPSPPQSRPVEMPAVAATASKTPAVLSPPALPTADPALRPAEPVSAPAAVPVQAATVEDATGGSAAIKPAKTAQKTTPTPQHAEQSPPPANPSPPATASAQPFPAATARPPAETTMQPPAEATVKPPAEATLQAPATATVQPPAAAIVQPPAAAIVQPPAAAIVRPPAAAIVQPPAAAIVQPRSGGGEQGYYVLAGESINRHKIEPLLKKLKKAGLRPVIREETKSREVYRLVAGCYGDRTSAEKQLPLILRTSRDAFLIRDKDSFCIIAGSLSSEKAALQEQKRMAGKGLQVEIARYTVPLAVWKVMIGYFTHAPEAEKVVEMLEAQGITATVVKPGN